LLSFFDDINYMTFWERLDKEIEKSNASRAGIARAVGISTNAIGLWTKRQTYPAADVAVKLARELNVTVEYLVEGEVSAGWLPTHIKVVVDDLMILNKNELSTVTKQVHALAQDQYMAASGGG
jgi:transcriptional regulator with XRE-family HTH domain